MRDRAQISLELPLQGAPDYSAYSTDILKRWLSGERDDAALLTVHLVEWLRLHLDEIETALEGDQRDDTLAEWAELERQR